MQIVMFDPGCYTPYYVSNLCSALTKRGYPVHLVSSKPAFEEFPEHEDYVDHRLFYRCLYENLGRNHAFHKKAWLRQTIKALSYPSGLWRTWKSFNKTEPGILHVQWALLPPLDLKLIGSMRALGWRIIYTAHDVLQSVRNPWTRKQTQRLFFSSDAIIVHTVGLVRFLGDEFGINPARVHVVPMGNQGLYLGRRYGKKEARQILGLDPERPQLLFFGMIKRHKGLDLLLKAIPLAKEQYPKFNLLIAGEPMNGIKSIEQRIDRLKISESVIIRPGFVPYEKVGLYFAASDLVILPYTRITMSSVLLTAYSYQRPVIATDVGALSESVDEGRTGFIVPPRSPDALAKAIAQGLSRPDLLDQMGKNAGIRADKHHNWTKVAAQTSRIYESLNSRNAKKGIL